MARRLRIPAFLPILGAVLALAAPATAAPHRDGEFLVAGLDGNSKLAEGPEGTIWATLPESRFTVASLTRAGRVEDFDLNGGFVNKKPSGITLGPEGRLWITFDGGVASFSPASPEGTVDATAIAQVTGAHSIVTGPDGNLWVATAGLLIKVPPANPTAFQLKPIGGLDPRDIEVAGPRLVVADAFEEGEKGRVVTYDPATDERKDFEIAGGSQGVAGSPDGRIGFGVQKRPPTAVGTIAFPAAPALTPAPGTDPFGAAFGPDGNFWFAQFLTDSLAQLSPGGTLTPLIQFPKGSQPKQILAASGNTLWVTLVAIDPGLTKIARISGVDKPVVASPPPRPLAAQAPETRLLGRQKRFRAKGRRAKVVLRFDSPDAAASFECRAVKLGAARRRRPAPPAFKACRSPQAFKLKPGAYRLEVRATRGGLADPTPAQRVVRVAAAKRKRR